NCDKRLFAHPHRFVVDRAPTAIWGSAPTRSTGQVADRVHISSPSASKHLTILRRAGFVSTERRQNLAVHSLTPLGEAILG
ncbi:helix-turn-helix domain-containing protein, partial [Streptomyces sampsonii]